MSLYKTSLKAKKEKSIDAWYDALHGLESGWEGGREQLQNIFMIVPDT